LCAATLHNLMCQLHVIMFHCHMLSCGGLCLSALNVWLINLRPNLHAVLAIKKQLLLAT
jgi:hypothetical protein